MGFFNKKKEETTVNVGSVNVVIDKIEIHHHHYHDKQPQKQVSNGNSQNLKDIANVAGAVGAVGVAGLGVVQFLADVATEIVTGAGRMAINGIVESAQIAGDAINAKQLASKNGNLTHKELDQAKRIESRWK